MENQNELYESLIEPKIVVNGREVTDPIEKRLWMKYFIHTEYATLKEAMTCNAPVCETCKKQCMKVTCLTPKANDDGVHKPHQFCNPCFDKWKAKQPLLGELIMF